MNNDIALLVIDMQVAYFANGSLQDRQTLLVSNCNRLIKAAQAANRPVYNIRTEHQPDGTTWTVKMKQVGQGYLFAGSEEANNVPGLEVNEARQIIKTRDSAFWHTELESELRRAGIKRLILCGVSTHSCIMLSAADAYAADFETILASDAIASHDMAYHEQTLELLEQEYDQIIEPTDHIVRRLKL